jgi:Fem-1 family protein b
MSMITTEFNGTSENEFINLLLSAARQGDANALENHLFTITNPTVYLNRTYDEAHAQKCTLLTIACVNGHTDVIRTLLSHFKPELEVLNNVILGDTTPNQHIFSNVSVLWVAASINNFEIVKLLVEHGANVNHTTKTNSTPLRGACYNGNLDMARYLVENGADIYIAKENNDTNLMVSVCHKRFDIVTYLVDELKYDVNACDNDGRSPLYDAVNCGSLELVEFLLKHGARNFRAIKDQMSPLMWAAEKKRVDLLQAISSYCSLLEQIEAEELIASAFICGPHGDRALDQAFEHFSRAFELRLTHDLSKSIRLSTNEIFGNQQECETVDELRKIRSNFNRMYIEALLVRERLLGSTNAEYRYSLCYRGAILADNEQHQEAVTYWIYELSLCQEYSIPLDAKHLRRFASLFSGILCKIKSIPVESLLIILSATTKELEHHKDNFNYNLYTLLFLITIMSQV